MERVLAFSVRARLLVIFLTVAVAAIGLWNLARLPIDAVPDITNKQVTVTTAAPSLSPIDIESRVSVPIETALAGIPGLETTRSLSRNGFSQVTAVFADSVAINLARQQVTERLAQARSALPPGADPVMGPITTGLGEIVFWVVDFSHRDGRGGSLTPGRPGWQSLDVYLTPEGERLTDAASRAAYLRTVQDWIVRPQLRTVAGVAGVDSAGGFEKQFVVEPIPNALAAYGVSLSDLITALERANLSVGGDFVPRGAEALVVRADARLKRLDDVRTTAISTRNGVPVMVADVATVRSGGGLRAGAATSRGHEAVVGTALMLTGANSRIVAQAVTGRLAEVVKSLPPDVTVEVVYDRSKLVDATITTVTMNLAEGAALVIVVLFLMLGNVRAALIAALVIPFAMLMTAIGMRATGVSANLMSLGALDFGLIVDGAVIIVENSLRRFAYRQDAIGRALTLPERLEETVGAAREMIKPSVYGQAIILLVYAPLLTFEGVEGRTFSPMAITVMLALAAAFVLSLTFVPAAIALAVRGPVDEREVGFVRATRRIYAPALAGALARPWAVVGTGVALFGAALLTFTTLGSEFTPRLDEGDVLLEILRVPSVSLSQAVVMQRQMETAVAKVPEVSHAFSRVGTAEAATDPMPIYGADGFVILKPRAQWPEPDAPREEVNEKIEHALSPLLGNSVEISQPIQMRFNELIAGVRSDVAVKIYGDDLGALGTTARRLADVLRSVPGASGVRADQTAGVPTLDVVFDRNAIARYGLGVQDVTDVVATALAGREAGSINEGDRSFPVVVRLPDSLRADPAALGNLPVALPRSGEGPRPSVPLSELASFRVVDGVNQVSRENGKRVVIVQANVRGRDIGSFVADARSAIGRDVRLPTGAWLGWGGQFETLAAAQARLTLIVPLVFLLIGALLYGALGSVRLASAVFSAVPMGLAGGVFALALRGMPFSISAAVGFIALSGVAVLNGLVMMTSINKRLSEGHPPDEAIREGALERLRPVLLTAAVASLGFVPMALATGVGSEVQKPLATVVIGGLITATLLTLFVLPSIVRLILSSRSRLTQPSITPASSRAT